MVISKPCPQYTDNGDGVVQEVTYEGVPHYGPATAVIKTAPAPYAG